MGQDGEVVREKAEQKGAKKKKLLKAGGGEKGGREECDLKWFILAGGHSEGNQE